VRLVPGLDRALGEAPGLVGNHQVDVHLDEIAEAVTLGTGPEGVVEGEQSRLRLDELCLAARALEALGEVSAGPTRDLHQGPSAALAEGDLEGVHQAAARALADLDAVHDDRGVSLAGHRRRRRGGRLRVVDVTKVGAQEDPPEAPLAQAVEGGGAHRVDPEAHQEPFARRLGEQGLGRGGGGVPPGLLAALVAERPPHPGVEKAEMVLHLGRGAHGRAGAAREASLPDGDRRADPLHLVHPGLLHPLEELASVGGQALHVPTLAFRVQGVEGQAALARPRHPGHHDQLAGGDRDVDPPQVVNADSPQDDISGHGQIPTLSWGGAPSGKPLPGRRGETGGARCPEAAEGVTPG
jgi:hypothetical protein